MSHADRMHWSWRASLALVVLGVPWLVLRTFDVFGSMPEPETLGEGAAGGIFIAGAIGVGLGLAAMLALSLLFVLVVDTAAKWSKPYAAITSLVVTIPWMAVFYFLAVIDGVIPSLLLAIQGCVVALSVAHLLMLARDESYAPKLQPVLSPPAPQAASSLPPPPPPTKPNEFFSAQI